LAGTWTYDVANNVITVVGATQGSPAGFVDAWTADKAGTLSLHARTGISAADGSAVNLTRNARPTDRVVLGGAKQDLYIVVTAWTNMTAATVQLTGTNTNDAAQTEDLAITGNGTYYTTKYFKTLTKSQVTVFTKSDSGSFAYEVKQGQWGRVWKTGTAQFQFDCKLYVGDGSTETWFVDVLKQVTFSAGIAGAWEFLLFGRLNAHVTFGALLSSTLKTSSSGCMFRSLEQNNNAILFVYIQQYGALYSCTFAAVDPIPYHFVTVLNDQRIWNCSCIHATHFWGCRADIYNAYVTKSAVGFMDINPASTLNRLTVTDCGAALYAYGNVATTVANAVLRNNTSMMRLISTSVDSNLINIDSDAWTFEYYGTCTGKIYRRNEIDLKVTDKDNTAINGATATLKDKDGNTIFSVATNGSGDIATQTVSRGYYDQAHGNTLQDYGPHTLTISKAGYQTYVKKFVLAAKTAWEVKLARANTVLFDQGAPVLDVKPLDPENRNVVVL
jgi:hypothetical protein